MKTLKVDKSKYDSSFSLMNKLLRGLWNVCYYLLFRPFISRVFKKWRVFVLKCFGAKVEWTSNIYSSVKIWAPWNLEMGKFATLGPLVDCYNQGRIKIGDHSTISQKSYLCASSHDISDPKHALILKPIEIKEECWIAADSFIGPGVTIGRGSVIAARSAVFSNVTEWTVVGGNPAKLLKERIIRSE